MNKLLELERQNLINWYPFKDEASILVLSEDRGIYNFFSDKHFDVEYVQCTADTCGNVYKKEYDYIILDGVLSFAPSYCRSEDSFIEFVNKLSVYLKQEGIFLIAVPNKLGLKYICGAPEQYTGAIGAGLNGYEFVEKVRTFSKNELEELVEKAGFEYIKFYYPYPDYIYPREIYTDDTIGGNSYGRDYYELIKDRLLLYNESVIAAKLASENVADVFANSFLIEISHSEIDDKSRPSYVKINSDRNDAFKISTSFVYEDGNQYVIKSPISESAIGHIRHLHEIEENNESIRYSFLSGEYDNNLLKYKFLKDMTLDNLIEKFIERQDKKKILESLDDMYNILLASRAREAEYCTEKFKEVFGETKLGSQTVKCVNPANIDLICDNIFLCDSVYTIIDAEWTFSFDIPIVFIIWRTLNELYYKHSLLENIIRRVELNQHYNIKQEDERVFADWNRFFTLNYVGANKIEQFAKSKYQVSLDSVLNEQNRRNMICSSLYIDYGEGYKEENKIYSESKLHGNRFSIEFHIDNYENVKQLRWDPVENMLCNCLAEIKAGGKRWRINAVNAETIDEEWDYFKTMDPQYNVCDIELKECIVVIEGKIHYLEQNKLTLEYSDIQGKYEKSIMRVESESKSRDLIRKYASILELEHEELVEENQRKLNDISQLKRELEQARTKIIQIEAEKNAEKEAKNRYVNMYNSVVSTKGWRVLEKMRKLKNKIKG